MTTEMATQHIPVMPEETVRFLRVRPGGVYVDCTVGLGGHAGLILNALGGRGRLLALDRDSESLEIAADSLSKRFPNVSFHHENFKNLVLVLNNLGIRPIDGCLVDLGVSRYQLTTGGRGFSFSQEGPLDMRMDLDQQTTAAELVNRLSEEELSEIFRKFGEERFHRKIAAAITERRRQARIETTRQLSQLVEKVKGPGHSRIHPATQVFQALRIAVNQELTGLEEFLNGVIPCLRAEGRLVVISFHSLEDRIVKRSLQLASGKCVCFKPRDLCTCPRKPLLKILTRKPIAPSELELRDNPSSRSARLRAAERLPFSSLRSEETTHG